MDTLEDSHETRTMVEAPRLPPTPSRQWGELRSNLLESLELSAGRFRSPSNAHARDGNRLLRHIVLRDRAQTDSTLSVRPSQHLTQCFELLRYLD